MNQKSLVTLALILGVTHYAAFQAGQSNLFYQVAAGGSAATASQEKSRSVYGVNQVLRYSPSRIDFATIPDDEPQSRLVEFENSGPNAVNIQRVKSSCGCTSARLLSDSEVPPGGKGQLEITINPALSSPDFSVSISISYDERPEIDRLLVSGKILRQPPP